MHLSALKNCIQFAKTYLNPANDANKKIVEIGSQDVNGSLRNIFSAYDNYLGVDFVPGKGVDIVLNDPYHISLESNSVDFVLSSSCLEHSDMFWLVYLEIIRILKPGGLFYLNVPSSGIYHRYPVDSWRFYPDAALSLSKWANRNGYNTQVLESFIDNTGCGWRNNVSITIKNGDHVALYPNRMVTNGPIEEMNESFIYSI
jgi:SAM-dependent methyltransferase